MPPTDKPLRLIDERVARIAGAYFGDPRHVQLCIAAIGKAMREAHLLVEPQSAARSQEPASPWQDINTAPNSDDLIWLMRGDSIDGPRPLDPYDFDRYEFWAPCEPPSRKGVAPSSDLPQEPVAWRYRYSGLESWKYVESENQCNPHDEYERQPLYAANSASESPMPEQLKMHPGLVSIVDKLSSMPRVYDWPAEDCRVLLGFAVLHAAYATLARSEGRDANG